MIYIPLFLLIFQPFGVNNYDPTHQIRLEFLIGALGFGIVNGIGLWVFEFGITPYLFPENTRFIFAIRISLELLLLSATTFLFYNVLGNFHNWNIPSFLGFIRDVGMTGLIPLGLIFLYFNDKKTRTAYNILLKQPKLNFPEKKLIKLTSDNNKDAVSLMLDALLYIEAQDNYIALFYLENENVKKILLRSTMKNIELRLKNFPVVRCHRSFLVNTLKIEKVTGNTNQLRLHIPNVDFYIPVSRTYLPILKKRLEVYHV